MSQPHPDPPPQLQAALEYAGRGIAVVASHFPVPVPAADLAPGHPGGALACSCGRADCHTPARHPVWAATVEDATVDTVSLVQWWVAVPDANPATPAGGSFDLVEVCHPTPTGRILRWLAMQGIGPGPVIQAGPTHHQFLVAPGGGGWRFAMTERGGLVRLGRGGGLILLPPSRLVHGAASRWLRPLGAAALPDGERVYEALAGLPGGASLP